MPYYYQNPCVITIATTPPIIATATTNVDWWPYMTVTASTAINWWPSLVDPVSLSIAKVGKHTKKAKKRAHDLLLEHLTEEQRIIFQEHKYFEVRGSESGRLYRIRIEEHLIANIDVLGEWQNGTYRLCGHCSLDEIPLGDQLLAQKLMLEGMEDEFLRVANRHA